MADAPLLPGVRKEYSGFAETLKKCASYIRTCGDDGMFQQFAGAILDKCYPRGAHTTNLQVTQCLLDYCNKNIRFRPDPPLTELVKSPMITLCVPGASACIPIEDCESHVAAYLALCRAMGVDVQMLKQTLHDPSQPPGEQEVHHLAGLVRMEDGRWLKVDPSLKGNSRVGEAQRAIREEAIDVLDPTWSGSAGGPKFVAIGATPKIFWENTIMTQNFRPMFDAFGTCLAGGGAPTIPGKACSQCAAAKRPKSLGAHPEGSCGDEDCEDCDSNANCSQQASGGDPGKPCCAGCAGQPGAQQPAAPPGSSVAVPAAPPSSSSSGTTSVPVPLEPGGFSVPPSTSTSGGTTVPVKVTSPSTQRRRTPMMWGRPMIDGYGQLFTGTR